MTLRAEKFKPGDRVRVYQGSRMAVGEVQNEPKQNFPCGVVVLLDAFDEDQNLARWHVHEKQCRKLRRREKKERVRHEWWILSAEGLDETYPSRKHAEEAGEAYDGNIAITHVVELPEGSAIVSRESLWNAWTECAGKIPNMLMSDFPDFCKALGVKP